MARAEDGETAAVDEKRQRPAAALRRLVRLEHGEGRAVFWSCAYFFCLLSSYYTIRPVRDALGVAGDGERLTWLFMGTLGAMFLANPVFGALVTRYPRRVFVPVVYHFFAANLIAFHVLLRMAPTSWGMRVGGVFFVWTSVFNLFAVSVFWGFMADTFRSEQGKRLFGLIGVGGTLGAIAGAGLTSWLARPVGPVNLMLASAGLLEVAVLCVRRLPRPATPTAPTAASVGGETRPESDTRAPGHGAWRGIKLVLASPYLTGICLFLLFYSVSSTFLYFEQARIVRSTFVDPAERTAFFARIDLYGSVLTVFVQCFLSGRIVQGIGVGATLSLLPAVTLAGLAGLAAAPVVPMLVVVQVVRRGTNFALARPAREVLFTVVTREQKYSSKSFIDTFVYRAGDAIGAWSDRLLALLNVGAGGSALAFLPLAVLWAGLSVVLGRRQREKGSSLDMLEPATGSNMSRLDP